MNAATGAKAMPAALPIAVDERPVLVSHLLCPYVQRAAIVLAEKGVDFRRVDIDLAAKPAWFLALSPLGKTPMLLVRDGHAVTPIFESAVICDYLDETRAPALHPAAPLARAQHRAWVEVASATLNQIWQLYTAPDEAAFHAARDGLRRRFEQLEGTLPAAGPWFAGAAFSVVDAAFAPAFRYFEVIEADDLLDGLPRLGAWRAALAARPSVRGAMEPGYALRLRDFIVRQRGWLGARFTAEDEADASNEGARPDKPEETDPSTALNAAP
jgi:glutathione S-transferase